MLRVEMQVEVEVAAGLLVTFSNQDTRTRTHYSVHREKCSSQSSNYFFRDPITITITTTTPGLNARRHRRCPSTHLAVEISLAFVLAFNGPKLSSFQSIGPWSPCNYLPPTTTCDGGCSSQAVPGLFATSSHRIPGLFQQTSDAAAAALLWACLRMVAVGFGPLPPSGW
jgi:hypothetical protein